ncbi:MAG: putative colanic acid biosynthesis acetyltransferase [Tepidisphaera sp.]|nr:putative colanic acid biosynthesis acetyltransferase [Tepidisphaera sp.]
MTDQGTPPTGTPAPASKGGPSSRLRFKNPNQSERFRSPWPLREKFGMLGWLIVERCLCRPTPKFLNGWRLFWLRLFGCKISGTPFVHPASIIKIPWQLTLEDQCAIGAYTEIYNLGHVTLKRGCTVAQYTYVCGGTHDLSDPVLPLQVADIVIGEEVFIGAKAIILPGVIIGDGAVLGAGSVTSKDLEPWTIYAGNPARPIKKRKMDHVTPGSRRVAAVQP